MGSEDAWDPVILAVPLWGFGVALFNYPITRNGKNDLNEFCFWISAVYLSLRNVAGKASRGRLLPTIFQISLRKENEIFGILFHEDQS